MKVELDREQLNLVIWGLKHLQDYPLFGHLGDKHRSGIIDLLNNLWTLRENINKTEQDELQK